MAKWERNLLTQKVKCPFEILHSNEEQLPYLFQGIPATAQHGGNEVFKTLEVNVRRCHLETGDYSFHGGVGLVTVERKSMVDLFATLTSGRDRFEREIVRMSKFDHAVVVVEADWSQISKGLPSRDINPRMIHQTVTSWEIDFPHVHWHFLPNRRYAEVDCFAILEMYWRKINEPKEKNKHALRQAAVEQYKNSTT